MDLLVLPNGRKAVAVVGPPNDRSHAPSVVPKAVAVAGPLLLRVTRAMGIFYFIFILI